MDRYAYDKARERLNDEQRLAVTTIWEGAEKPCAILAGAGSGKTATMVVALAGIHWEGVMDPKRVVATTFTRAGEQEMQERLNQLVMPGTIGRVLTYDKIVWRWVMSGPGKSHLQAQARARGYEHLHVLAERPMDTMLGSGRSLSPDSLMKTIVTDTKALTKKGDNLPGAPPGWAGLNYHDRWSEDIGERRRIQGYYAVRERIRGQGLFFDCPTTAEAAYAAIPDCLNELQMDLIADNVARAIGLFEDVKKNYRACERLDPMFWYYILARDPVSLWLVDEAQDNTQLQINIARDKSDQGREAYGRGTYGLIGDARQSIYDFRSAAPNLIMEVARTGRLATLRSNYRSGRIIVEAGNAVAAGHDWNVGGTSIPARNMEGAGRLHGIRFSGSPWAGIAARIRDGIRDGTPSSAFGILCRRNADCDEAQAALDLAGVPCVRLGTRGGPWDQPIAQSVLAWIAVATQSLQSVPNPSKWAAYVAEFPKRTMVGVALQATIGEQIYNNPGPASRTIRGVLGAARGMQQRDAVQGLAEDMAAVEGAFQRSWMAGLQALAQVFEVDFDPEEALEANEDLGEEMQDTASIIRLKAPADDEPDADAREEQSRDKAAIRIILRAAVRKGTLPATVEAQILGAKTPVFPEDTPPEERARLQALINARVAVSTIHGAKGKEWPHVFLFTPPQGFDSRRPAESTSNQPDRAYEEAQRLLYVGVTRARDELMLFWDDTGCAEKVQRVLLPMIGAERERAEATMLLHEAAGPTWTLPDIGTMLRLNPLSLSMEHRLSPRSYKLLPLGDDDYLIHEVFTVDGVPVAYKAPLLYANVADALEALAVMVQSGTNQPRWLPLLQQVCDIWLEATGPLPGVARGRLLQAILDQLLPRCTGPFPDTLDELCAMVGVAPPPAAQALEGPTHDAGVIDVEVVEDDVEMPEDAGEEGGAVGIDDAVSSAPEREPTWLPPREEAELLAMGWIRTEEPGAGIGDPWATRYVHGDTIYGDASYTGWAPDESDPFPTGFLTLGNQTYIVVVDPEEDLAQRGHADGPTRIRMNYVPTLLNAQANATPRTLVTLPLSTFHDLIQLENGSVELVLGVGDAQLYAVQLMGNGVAAWGQPDLRLLEGAILHARHTELRKNVWVTLSQVFKVVSRGDGVPGGVLPIDGEIAHQGLLPEALLTRIQEHLMCWGHTPAACALYHGLAAFDLNIPHAESAFPGFLSGLVNRRSPSMSQMTKNWLLAHKADMVKEARRASELIAWRGTGPSNLYYYVAGGRT